MVAQVHIIHQVKLVYQVKEIEEETGLLGNQVEEMAVAAAVEQARKELMECRGNQVMVVMAPLLPFQVLL